MELKQYKELVAQLLRHHYGQRLEQTGLTDEALSGACTAGVPAFAIVNQQAVAADLKRTDLAKGIAYPRAPLGKADEYWATLRLSVQTVRAGLSIVRAGMAPLDWESFADTSLVIYSPAEDDGLGFWSNDDGWTMLDNATLFTQAEREKLNLPFCPGGDACWITLAQALALQEVHA